MSLHRCDFYSTIRYSIKFSWLLWRVIKTKGHKCHQLILVSGNSYSRQLTMATNGKKCPMCNTFVINKPKPGEAPPPCLRCANCDKCAKNSAKGNLASSISNEDLENFKQMFMMFDKVHKSYNQVISDIHMQHVRMETVPCLPRSWELSWDPLVVFI